MGRSPSCARRGSAAPKAVTGGQPAPRHFEALKAAGVEVVLDIRDPMENRFFDEPAVVRAAGMEYVNVPVVQGRLNDAMMERILDVVRQNEHRSLLFHCASGNRVAGPMIAYLMLDRGISEDEALAEGMKMGLRGADILEWGLDYVRRFRRGCDRLGPARPRPAPATSTRGTRRGSGPWAVAP